MMINAVIAVAMIVSPLKVMPNSSNTIVWCPTWMAAPPSSAASTVSVIRVSSILRIRCGDVLDVQAVGADLLQHRDAGAHHQQCLEDCQPEQHRNSAVCLEVDGHHHGDCGDDQQSRGGVYGHFLLEWVVLHRDRLDGPSHQQCVEQTETEPDTEEHTEEDVADITGGRDGHGGERQADQQEPQRTEAD